MAPRFLKAFASLMLVSATENPLLTAIEQIACGDIVTTPNLHRDRPSINFAVDCSYYRKIIKYYG